MGTDCGDCYWDYVGTTIGIPPFPTKHQGEVGRCLCRQAREHHGPSDWKYPRSQERSGDCVTAAESQASSILLRSPA